MILTLGLLATAGFAILKTEINVQGGLESYLTKAAAGRHYDLRITTSTVRNRRTGQRDSRKSCCGASTKPGFTPAALSRPDNLDLVQNYRWRTLEVLHYVPAPPGSKFIETPLIAGRLETGGENSMALDQNTGRYSRTPKSVTNFNQVNGLDTNFKLVGSSSRVLLSPAAAYVIPSHVCQSDGTDRKPLPPSAWS
ncbi:MAG: hypothetical protein IPN58_20150 [Anaerolineales bacterium]|nr:hypothetical protein [Anaerolineales bacterium]